PELSKRVDCNGPIITSEAMGTQRSIAAQIVDGQADYVLALKGNQDTLHQQVIDYVDEQLDNDFADAQARRHITKETGHGREEIRTYLHMPVPEDWQGLEQWKGLKAIGMATLVGTGADTETAEARD